MLPRYLRVLQGDGISYETLKEVLAGIDGAGWSTENLVFGSGGALLQKVNRDTQKCAFKCSFAIVDGQPVSMLLAGTARQPVFSAILSPSIYLCLSTDFLLLQMAVYYWVALWRYW